jgi:hypothetical protein
MPAQDNETKAGIFPGEVISRDSGKLNQTNLGSISLSSLRSSDGETGPKFD